MYAATEARVRQSYAEIATVANLQIPKDPRAVGRYTGLQGPGDIESARQPQTDLMQLVNSWLQSDESGYWLMIFDSADSHLSLVRAFAIDQDSNDVATSKKESLAHMLPRSPMGTILITTRNKKLALDLTHTLLEVPPMDDVEAEKLVQDKLKNLDSRQVDLHLLVNLLGYLPLALVQAAAYIRKTTITIHKYIELYNKDEGTQMRLLGQDFSDLERDQNAENAVLKTWILSFEQIKMEDPQAADLLSIMSFLDAQHIPESLLRVVIPDSLDLIVSLATLKAFALVTSSEDDESFDVHRMVQCSMQQWLVTRQESSSWVNKALGTLGTAYADDRLTGDTLEKKLDDYYPHTIAALAVESGPTPESLWNRAILWRMAGITLQQNYLNAKAHEKFLVAVKLFTDLLGDADPTTLNTTVLAGQNLYIWRLSDELSEAKQLLIKASNGFEAAAGPQHIETLAAKVILAKVYTKAQEWKMAKDVLTPMLSQSEDDSKCSTELIEVIVDAKEAMAHIYQLEGNLSAAETLQLEVVTSLERAFTREDERTQAAIHSLASMYVKIGQLDKAVNLLEDSLRSNRCCVEKHPSTHMLVPLLAEVYCKLERYKESLGILEELLPLMQEYLDRDDPRYISVIEQIAESLCFLHRDEEGVKLCEQALAMRRQRQGFDHVKTLESAIKTAKCYILLRRYNEGLELLKEVVSRSKRVLGDEHPMTLKSMVKLAVAHIVMDQGDVGGAMLREVWLLKHDDDTGLYS